jgi:hypothetical protein
MKFQDLPSFSRRGARVSGRGGLRQRPGWSRNLLMRRRQQDNRIALPPSADNNGPARDCVAGRGGAERQWSK